MVSLSLRQEIAYYALARSVALAVLFLVALVNGSHEWLMATALGMIIVQGLDSLVGYASHDRLKTFIPLAAAIANLAALVWLLM